MLTQEKVSFLTLSLFINDFIVFIIFVQLSIFQR